MPAANRAPDRSRDVDRGTVTERGREEPTLGRGVGVERSVVVEVVLREVREAHDREARAVDAVLIERVRRHFHRDRLHTGVTHAREQ
jgi:hypothetical protein